MTYDQVAREEREQVERLLEWLGEHGYGAVALTVFKARPLPKPFSDGEALARHVEANLFSMLAVTPEILLPETSLPRAAITQIVSRWVEKNELWLVTDMNLALRAR